MQVRNKAKRGSDADALDRRGWKSLPVELQRRTRSAHSDALRRAIWGMSVKTDQSGEQIMGRRWLFALGLVLTGFYGSAVAQTWPTKQLIRAIVPFSPGSAADIIGRVVLDQVSKQIGQTIVIENRVGAGGHDWHCRCRQSRRRWLYPASHLLRVHDHPVDLCETALRSST